MFKICCIWLFYFIGMKGMICIYFLEENRLNLFYLLFCEFIEKIINSFNWKIF